MSRANPLMSGWIRAVLVVAAIPALWAAELWVGLVAARSPELIFGDVVHGAAFIEATLPVLIGAVFLWIILKTPFAALSWALRDHEYDRNIKEVEASE